MTCGGVTLEGFLGLAWGCVWSAVVGGAPGARDTVPSRGGQVNCLGGYSSAVGSFSRQKGRLREKLVAIFS